MPPRAVVPWSGTPALAALDPRDDDAADAPDVNVNPTTDAPASDPDTATPDAPVDVKDEDVKLLHKDFMFVS